MVEATAVLFNIPLSTTRGTESPFFVGRKRIHKVLLFRRDFECGKAMEASVLFISTIFHVRSVSC